MSSISSVGQSLYQLFQNVSQTAQPPIAGTSSDPASGSTGQAAAASGHHHHHHGHGGGGFSKIEQAVTSALQSASNDDSTDPNQTIEDAIAKVFQNGASSGSSLDSTSDNTTAAASNGSPQQSFLQTLQSFGVDPQQFHQDFLSAIQDAQGGQADPSKAFQSFPPGTVLDTNG